MSKIIAVITARGGSKRLPGKNTKLLGGVPLIAWSIRAAKGSKLVDRLILSSDDSAAIDIAKGEKCDVPFVRPAELAGDHSTSYDVVEHALKTIGENYEWLVLLQPTSPFRTAEDIDAAIKFAQSDPKIDSVIGVCPTEKSHVMFFTRDDKGLLHSPSGISLSSLNHTRGQDMPATYEINGAIYVVRVSWLLKNKVFFDDNTVSYVMPMTRSINIDTEHDWKMAEAYLSKQ